jgi:hypothetical protein
LSNCRVIHKHAILLYRNVLNRFFKGSNTAFFFGVPQYHVCF